MIVSLAGISLRPVIDGYGRWKARLEAMELHERAVASMEHEIVMLGREIRATQPAALIEEAERILPRGRVSRISSAEKLEALKGMLEALLAQPERLSGDTKSSIRTREIFAPNTPNQAHRKTVPARLPRKATLISQLRSLQPWPPALRARITGLCCHPCGHRAGQTLSKLLQLLAFGRASPSPLGPQPVTRWAARERRCRCLSSIVTRVEDLRTGDGRVLATHVRSQIDRELDRLELIIGQIKVVEDERAILLAEQTANTPAAMLHNFTGIGPEFATILYAEGLFHHFDNRRQLAAYAGLAPTPWQTGSIRHEQGVSKAGNSRLRMTMNELS